MTSYDDLHAKYARGDHMTNEELATLHGYVSRLASEVAMAPSLVGRATLHYLLLLKTNLRSLCDARKWNGG